MTKQQRKSTSTATPTKPSADAPARATRPWTPAEGRALCDAAFEGGKPVPPCPVCGSAVVERNSDSHIVRVYCTGCSNWHSVMFG